MKYDQQPNSEWKKNWQGWHRYYNGHSLLLRSIRLGVAGFPAGYVAMIDGSYVHGVKGYARNQASLKKQIEAEV